MPSPKISGPVPGVKRHMALHPVPSSVSTVHATPSLHIVGHEPVPLGIAVSQSSGVSTTPLPHLGEQSRSLIALHEPGQQPSPWAHVVIAVALHAAEQPEPTRRSNVHDMPSLHDVGQAPGPLVIAVSHA